MVGSISQSASALEKTTQAIVTSEKNHVDRQSSREVYSITYALPGQVGFCVPRIITQPKYRQSLVALIEAESLVTNLQVNDTAGSILISYKSGMMSDFEMRSHLINLIHSASDVLKQTTIQPAPPGKVAHSITYALPGQVGFCVPRIITQPKYRQSLLALLEAENLVTNLQVNDTAGSIVVTYQSGMMSDFEMRSHLMNLIQSASDALIADKKATIQPAFSYPIPSHTNSRQKQDKKQLTSAFESFNAHVRVSSSRPQPATFPVQQPAKVAYSIAHAIPGRVRFRVPRIAQDPKYVQRLEALLKADPKVIGERVNRWASSIVITYKSAFKREHSVLEAAISYLANLLQNASDVAIA